MNKNASEKKVKPMVSLVIPAYNEEAIIFNNLRLLCEYMDGYTDRYNWELIIVNDGSKDNTGKLADDFACNNEKVKVYHHIVNLNLGNALKTGFAHVSGEYTITLDLDLSYAAWHIGKILETLETTGADVVLASPYMKGGKVTAVPFMRRILSKWVN